MPLLTFITNLNMGGGSGFIPPIVPPVVSKGFGIYGVSYRRKRNNELEVQIDEKVDRTELRKFIEERMAGPATEKAKEQEIRLGFSKRDLDAIIVAILASEL